MVWGVGEFFKRRGFLGHRGSGASGVALVELLIGLPVLFLIVLGVTDVTFAIRETNVLVDATRHASRAAASLFDPSDTTPPAYTGQMLEDYLTSEGYPYDPADWDIVTSYVDMPEIAGDVVKGVKVAITRKVDAGSFVGGMSSYFWPGIVTLHAESVFPVEAKEVP